MKAANRLSTVIAELTGQTFRRVGDENRFLCPFHPDTNPSFDANDEKDGGVYCCRSCGAKGDVIAFVQQHERLDLQASLAFWHSGEALRPQFCHAATTLLVRSRLHRRCEPKTLNANTITVAAAFSLRGKCC